MPDQLHLGSPSRHLSAEARRLSLLPMSAAAAEKGCATVVFGKKCLCTGFIADKWKPITCKGCMHTKNDHYGIEVHDLTPSYP